MGVTKTELFTEEQNTIANISKALAHPARIAILQHLLKLETCVCGDLVSELGLAQATISQHLRELKNIGIIKGNIEGTSVCYCIDAERWAQIQGLFSNIFNQYQIKKGNCC